MKAKEFKLHRNQTVASTCGLSVEFVKGVYSLVAPAMWAEVQAIGAVAKDELEDDTPAAAPIVPTDPAVREEAIFEAFRAILLKADRADFTAAGIPHAAVLSQATGWSVEAKERDKAWKKFQAAGDKD